MRIITGVAIALLFIATAAQADALYAISGSAGAPSTLYKLDKTDGSVIATIGATGFSHVTGIAFHPTTGVLYGVVSDLYGPTGNTQLITIDTTTGAGTLVGTTGFQLPDIAFAPDGTLYGWVQLIPGTFPVGLEYLVSIDLTSGLATQVGGEEFYTAGVGLGIDSTGTAWMKTSQFGASDSLFSIDLGTGLSVPVGDASGLGPRILEAGTNGPVVNNMLAFDGNNVLYSGRRTGQFGAGGFNLFTIDLGVAFPDLPSATLSLVGSNDIGNISGIAFKPVPEPGSLLLLAAGAIIVARRRRRA